MKNPRLIIAILVVTLVVGGLIYASIVQTAKAVLTVNELAATGTPMKRIRVGARVTDDQIEYRTTPDFRLKFAVHDIAQGGQKIDVVYHGLMPDTLKGGRDVILEGDFDGTTFEAKTLLTQCPSKYEPPLPGVTKGQ